MVQKMNKTEFIKALSQELGCSEKESIIINDVLENNFFISRKNRKKIIAELIDRLKISREKASEIYNAAVTVINREIKNKLKHPFGGRH